MTATTINEIRNTIFFIRVYFETSCKGTTSQVERKGTINKNYENVVIQPEGQVLIVIRLTPAIAFFQYTDVNKTSIYTNVPYKLTNKD